jgi:hypothetical protein
MFYQVFERDALVSRHKSRRDAYRAVAQNLDARTLRAVKYQHSTLTTVHEFSREEIEEGLRRIRRPVPSLVPQQ